MMQSATLRTLVAFSIPLFLALCLPQGSEGERGEAFDKSYDDPADDVIDYTGSYLSDHPYVDILRIETDDDGADTVTGKMVLAAPPDSEAMYSIIAGDIDGEQYTMMTYMGTLSMITYADGSSSFEGISVEGDTITWLCDRDKMAGADSYDLQGSASHSIDYDYTTTYTDVAGYEGYDGGDGGGSGDGADGGDGVDDGIDGLVGEDGDDGDDGDEGMLGMGKIGSVDTFVVVMVVIVLVIIVVLVAAVAGRRKGN